MVEVPGLLMWWGAMLYSCRHSFPHLTNSTLDVFPKSVQVFVTAIM